MIQHETNSLPLGGPLLQQVEHYLERQGLQGEVCHEYFWAGQGKVGVRPLQCQGPPNQESAASEGPTLHVTCAHLWLARARTRAHVARKISLGHAYFHHV